MESTVLDPKLAPDEADSIQVRPNPDGPHTKWLFATRAHALVGVLLSLSTLGLYYLLTIAYPDRLTGPTWLICLFCYMPFFAAIILNRNCLTQIYVINFIVFFAIWLIIPNGVGVSFLIGIPFGIGFWLLAAVSLHIWSHRFKGDDIGMSWIIRFVSMFSVTLYIQGSIYGILVSPAIQFYRAPFALQPISVFGFGSFEILVIYTNLAIAWLACRIAQTKNIKMSLTPWRSNPFVVLVTVWVFWIIVAGIIRGTHSPVTSVKVATISGYMKSEPDSYANFDRAEALGRIIAERVRETGAEFVVAPEFILHSENGQRGCVESIQKGIIPQVQGLGAYVVIGCSAYDYYDSSRSGCRDDNLAYTVSPDGKIIDIYGKMNPTPGERSCYQPGYFVNEGHGIKFGTVICYDVDYISPIARVADLGASLILNPSHDWHAVRHHFSVSVVRAIENRVAIAKSEYKFDPVIVDPFGNILAQGSRRDMSDLFADVPLSQPLKVNWWRQQFIYWVWMAIYAALMVLDLIKLCNTSRK